MFDDLSAATRRLGEIGMIVRRGKQILGDANDAISTKEVCNALLGQSRPWQMGCHEALILGGGGAGLALANTLVTQKPLGCKAISIAEVDKSRAAVVRQRVASWRSDVTIQVVETDGFADALVSVAGPGSLIANATGLGKDRPGSPVSDRVVFPLGAHVWEFNYRFVPQSEPAFHEIAARQVKERDLTFRDGWDYFIWGWLVVMATSCSLPVEPYYPEFKKVADATRPDLSR
jgi:shikimate 5-dehydrogenase